MWLLDSTFSLDQVKKTCTDVPWLDYCFVLEHSERRCPCPFQKTLFSRFNFEIISNMNLNVAYSIGSEPGLMLSFILSIYVLQSSKDKLARYYFPSPHVCFDFELAIASLVSCSIGRKLIVCVIASRFVKETVADSSLPAGGVAKVE